MSDASPTGDDKLQAQIEAAGAPVAVTGDDGDVAFWNREIADLFGYDVGEFGGLSVRDLVPERLRDAHDVHVRRYGEQPRFRSIDSGIVLVGRRCDGSEFPVEISLGPFDHDGHSYVMVIVREAARDEPST